MGLEAKKACPEEVGSVLGVILSHGIPTSLHCPLPGGPGASGAAHRRASLWHPLKLFPLSEGIQMETICSFLCPSHLLLHPPDVHLWSCTSLSCVTDVCARAKGGTRVLSYLRGMIRAGGKDAGLQGCC